MRFTKWGGCVVVLVALLGILDGVAAYTFAGFPFGGGNVAKDRAEIAMKLLAFFVLLLIGIGMLVGCKLLGSKRGGEESDDKGGQD
jgi:hypothetical protein